MIYNISSLFLKSYKHIKREQDMYIDNLMIWHRVHRNDFLVPIYLSAYSILGNFQDNVIPSSRVHFIVCWMKNVYIMCYSISFLKRKTLSII
jgi:hypothetical protein